MGAGLGLYQAKESLEIEEEGRQRATNVAAIIRQQSADVTLMALSFITSRDPIFEGFFYHIIGISDGVWARPDRNDRDFWKRALVAQKLPVASERSFSTKALIDQLELSPTEAKELYAANNNTEELFALEISALKATAGFFVDSNGEYSIQKKPDIEFAKSILFGERHDEVKYEIGRALSSFTVILNRQSKASHLKYSLLQFYYSGAFILGLMLLCVFVGWLAYEGWGVEFRLDQITSLREEVYRLEESEKYYRGIFDNVKASIYTKDLSGRFLTVNRRFVEILGGEESDYIGKTDFDLFPDALAAAYRKNDKEVIEKGISIEFEERAYNVKSDQRFMSVKFPIKDNMGAIIAICGISSDILGLRQTDLGRAEWETQLGHSQKMEAVSQLTSGVAHDFNNILNIIHGNLELLKGRLSSDEDSLKRIENALKGTARGVEVTQKLFRFTQKKVQDVRTINVNTLIIGLEGLILKSLTQNISLKVLLAEDLWSVSVDPGDLEDAILNLALNARDAMPNGGIIVIEAENKILDEDHVIRNSDGKIGEHLMISISDTGRGIPDDVKEKVFEPFFTTKEQGAGTGLGLSMVYGFVKRSRGHLVIYSEIEEGTLIRIYIPKASTAEK